MKYRATSVMKWAVHLLAPVPLWMLIWATINNQLGPDPAEHMVRELGFWGITFLWSSLAMTPLKILTGKSYWVGMRRSLGLWSFFYISLHLTAFITFWCGLDFAIISEEIDERPYILLGLMGWLTMVPLAITSTRASRIWLGKRWLVLHRLVYMAGILGLLHLVLLAKLEYVKPVAFGIVLIFLFFIRIRARQAKATSIECASSA